MHLQEINIEYRVIAGISGMVVLFTSFLVVFIVSQRKKLLYHKELHALHEAQKESLRQQNLLLEQRVAERTKELSFQKDELQKSLAELKQTQLQLIQREKMASLGELTAGIAHEMQNPLNFVNNFSDMTMELTGELQMALKNDDKEEAAAVAEMISQNIEKINSHGKRAGSIVRSMLEHSKIDAGHTEPTDINKLVNECLKLSYAACKAKNAALNASIETSFDDRIGNISIVPQAIQRVLVNLFNNAFYAVSYRMKNEDENYKAVVSVTTCKDHDMVTVIVGDNGTGIPSAISGKIFQPFFTTKPTGEGTGLGLSLSYDIIKAHGGDISAESEEGAHTSFTVTLPAKV